MRQIHIDYPGTGLDYNVARGLAASLAIDDPEIEEPVLMAWHDKGASKMSPVIEGGDINTRWHDYGESHCGQIEINVNGQYDFVFADAAGFDGYGPSPYVNLSDDSGTKYLCQRGLLRDPHQPEKDACVALDDYTSQMT
jgi:hypothetical protein